MCTGGRFEIWQTYPGQAANRAWVQEWLHTNGGKQLRLWRPVRMQVLRGLSLHVSGHPTDVHATLCPHQRAAQRCSARQQAHANGCRSAAPDLRRCWHHPRDAAAHAGPDAPGDGSQPPPLRSRRTITSTKQLLHFVQQQEQSFPLEHGFVGRACILLLRLLAKHERALVVARRDARRALWIIPSNPATSKPTSTPQNMPQARQATASDGGARAELQDPYPAARQVLHLLLQYSAPWSSCSDPVAAAHLVQALGAVGYQPVPAAQLSELLAAMQPLLPSMQQDCLAKLLWGLGKMRHAPSKQWMQAATDAITPRSLHFGTQSTILLVEGLAGLPGRCPADLLLDLTTRIRPHLAWLTPRQCVTLLAALADMGYSPSGEWLADWCQHSSSKLSGLTMAQAARLAGCLLRLRYIPPAWWVRKYMHYSEDAMAWCDPHTGPSEVLSAAVSLARLNLEPPRSWLHRGLLCVRGLKPPLAQTRPRAPFVRGMGWPTRDGPRALPGAVVAAARAALEGAQAGGADRGAIGQPGVVVGRETGMRARPGDGTGVDSGVQGAGDASGVYVGRSAQSVPTGAAAGVTGAAVPAHVPARARRKDTAGLSPAQAVQAAYVIAKLRENPTAIKHVPWAQHLIASLLADVPGIVSNVWSPPPAPPAPAQRAPPAAAGGTGKKRRLGGSANTQAGLPVAQPQSAPPPALGQAAADASQSQMLSQPVAQASLAQSPEQPTSPPSPPLAAPKEPVSQRAQRLVDVWYACAELRYPPPAGAQAQLLGEVAAVLQHTTSAQRASVMVCLAVLRITPPAEWAVQFFAHMRTTLAAYSAQELANTLTAAAYLGLEPGDDLVHEVCQAALGYDLVQLAMLVRKLRSSRVATEVPWLAGIQLTAKQQLSGKA